MSLRESIIKRIGSILIIFGFLTGLFIAVMSARTCNTNPGKVKYKKDPRTGLCFAHPFFGYGLTQVPCEKVKKLLDQ